MTSRIAKSKAGLAAGSLALVLLAAPDASAFCRTTTCDPNKVKDMCQFDANRCVVTGKPLGWRSSCVTIGIQEMGSPRSGFTVDDVAPVLQHAAAGL
jgi:hypothetical protein